MIPQWRSLVFSLWHVPFFSRYFCILSRDAFLFFEAASVIREQSGMNYVRWMFNKAITSGITCRQSRRFFIQRTPKLFSWCPARWGILHALSQATSSVRATKQVEAASVGPGRGVVQATNHPRVSLSDTCFTVQYGSWSGTGFGSGMEAASFLEYPRQYTSFKEKLIQKFTLRKKLVAVYV